MEKIDSDFKTITDQFRTEMQNIRANRPSTALVEAIPVDYREANYTIQQLGSLSLLPPRTVVVTVWDQASAPAVAKAIELSGLGVTPSIDGSAVRFSLPPLTDERREDLIKLVKRTAEDFRIRLRGKREDLNKKIETDFKAKLLTEDQRFKEKKRVQEGVDTANGVIESLVASKIKEITE